MQKWEYLVESDPSREELNKLGNQGWELIAVTFTDFGEPAIFYFKRPKS